MRLIKNIGKELLEFLYPRKCPVCGRPVVPEGALICPPCRKKISFVREPRCRRCGKEILSGDREYCGGCAKHPRSFAYGAALMNYDSISRKILLDLKYRGRRDNADYLAAEAAKRLGDEIRRMDADALVPVPVHPRRRRVRGFNQAELLAKKLGGRLDIPVRTDILRRVRNTRPQRELGSLGRLNNLTRAFAAELHPGERLRRVILVDDIYTTGSTAEACTRALRSAGVGSVCLVSFAIGKDGG